MFCNKADVKEHKAADRLKVLLQREVDSLRKSSGTIGVAGATATTDAHSPDQGQPFSFDSPRAVAFASGSAVDPGAAGGLAAVKDFVRAHA